MEGPALRVRVQISWEVLRTRQSPSQLSRSSDCRVGWLQVALVVSGQTLRRGASEEYSSTTSHPFNQVEPLQRRFWNALEKSLQVIFETLRFSQDFTVSSQFFQREGGKILEQEPNRAALCFLWQSCQISNSNDPCLSKIISSSKARAPARN